MKVFKSLFFSILVHNLAVASHPFVGQYVNVPTLTRPDGTITMRLQEKPVKFNKYDHIIDKSFDSGKQKTIIQEVMEIVFHEQQTEPEQGVL